jgi:hypothetical protein
MKKMVAMVAFATALMIGGSAMAAPVDIFVRQTSATTWTIGATAQVDTGQIALVVSGFAGMVLQPLSQISALDSPFVGNLAQATLQITSNAGSDLIPIGQPELLLATLNGPGPFVVTSGDDGFGYTALNQALDTPLEYSLLIVPTPPVPEPTTMVLFGLGLAAMAAIRRSA